MAKAVYGISNAKMGAAGANGAMGTTLTDITQITEDSVQVTFPEPDKTPVNPEDMDGAFVNLETAGVKTIVLKTLNLDIANLPRFFGGAVTTGTFTPGVNYSLPEQSFQFTTRPLTGVSQTWKFPRVQCSVSIDSNPSKKNVMDITLTFTVLTPVDGSGVQLPDFSIIQA